MTGSGTPLSADEIFSHAFHAAPDAIVVSSQTRRILSANDAALELFGYPAAQITGMSARELYGPEEDWMNVETALRANGRTRTLSTMRHRTGLLFDAEITATAASDAQRHISGVVETIRVVSVDGFGSTLTPTPAPATTAVRLARGLAHDFNNLLAIITGNVQLADRRAIDAVAKRYLRDAEQACDMAARLTRSVMSFAEDRRLATDRIALASLLKAQKPLLAQAAGDAITLSLKIASNIPEFVTDRSALESALLNLVINARDAMPAGGKMTIMASAMRVPAGGPPLDLSAGEYVRITVADTGTGMTARVKARAFDPFFTTKDPGRGTGLGLATVSGFAKQSGGTAIIDSAPGQGTTVTLMLPIAPLQQSKRC